MIWVGEPRECFNSYPYIHKSTIFANCLNRLLWFDIKFLIQHNSLTVTWFIVFFAIFSLHTERFCSLYLTLSVERMRDEPAFLQFCLKVGALSTCFAFVSALERTSWQKLWFFKPFPWVVPSARTFFFCTQRELFLQVGIHEDSQYLGRADPSGTQKGAFWVRKTAWQWSWEQI